MDGTNTKTQEFDKPSVVLECATPDEAEVICDIRDKAWMAAYPNEELGITVEDVRKNAQGLRGEFVPRRVAYLKEVLAQENEPSNTTFIAKIDGKTVGYVTPHVDDTGRRTLSQIYVLPEYQGRGVGSVLMQKALDLLGSHQDIYLEVVSHNHKAVGFYEKFGFQKTDAVVPEEEGRPDFMKTIPQTEMVLRVRPRP